MPVFTVLKQVVSVYAVEVEAEDATDAIIKVYNGNGDPDLVDDYEQNEVDWEVFLGERNYPLPDDWQSLARDKSRILASMHPSAEE